MERKIAIGFVVYNSSSNLIHRLQEALSLGFAVYIFDNSPEKSIIRDFIKNNEYKNIGSDQDNHLI